MKVHPSIARRASLAFAAVALAFPVQAFAASTWRIDPADTHIAFAIDSVGYPRTQGQFRRFEGHIALDLDHPDRSNVTFRVQANSVDVGSQSLDDYLSSGAFLDAAKFPTIEFVSKSVQKLDDHTVRVSGDLTLLGVTKPLTVDVSVRREANSRYVFFATTSIDRLAFGMNSGFPLVSRDVNLTISSAAAEL